MSSRARAWAFTLNNPTAEKTDYEAIKGLVYLIVGAEVGESGTPHHQGYVRLRSATTFAAVKKKLPEGAHIEIARGSPQQNIEYCSKENIWLEIGDRPKQGQRKDIELVRDLVSQGVGMRDICDEVGSFQALRGAELILKYKEAKRDWVPEVYWFWGETGTGKTRCAHEMAVDPWVSAKNLRWWDGYDAHSDVIIDDFRGDFCTFHELLRILDRYEYRVETKGGSRQLLAHRIFITCPLPPEFVYQTVEAKAQLYRRITEIREFTKPEESL